MANFISLALQKRRFFFHEFFTVPINGKFLKSFEINSNAKIMQKNLRYDNKYLVINVFLQQKNGHTINNRLSLLLSTF